MSLLAVAGLTKRFGGVVANRDVSFVVAPGELVGIIGPNGAGKSTLFDLVTGFTAADGGEVRLDGRRITGRRPDEIARLGVARTFQKLRPFPDMTAVENVQVAMHLNDVPQKEAIPRAWSLLEKLDEETQAEIMNLLTLYPGETEDSLQALTANAEFEEPSPSML